MREPIEIYEWGAILAARLERGSVVLDERTNSILQLSEIAALALDVLADRVPASETYANHRKIREALPTVRRELLGESVLAPGEGVTLESRSGQPLLRRIAEPPHWRRASRGAKVGATSELTAAMVRMSDGVLVILPGHRRDLAELRSGLAELGPVALGSERPRAADDPEPAPGAVDLDLTFRDGKERAIAEYERRYVTELIRWADGNLSRAARGPAWTA